MKSVRFILKFFKTFIFTITPCLVLCIFIELLLHAYSMFNPSFLDDLLLFKPKHLAFRSIYIPHHYSLYELKPNYSNGLGTHHNNASFRNDYDVFPENKKFFRIVVIGGSTVYTIMIKDNKKIFTNLLETRLNQRYQKYGIKIQVLNAGLGGATSAENLIRIIFKISEYSPDILMIQQGLNDVPPRYYGKIKSDYSNYRKVFSLKEKSYESKLRYALNKISQLSFLVRFIMVRLGKISYPEISDYTTRKDNQGSYELVQVNSSQYFRRNSEMMIVTAKTFCKHIVFVTEPHIIHEGYRYSHKVMTTPARIMAMPEHNRILKELANKYSVTFFDLFKLFPQTIEMLPDAVHTSEKGSLLKAKLYFDFLIDNMNLDKLVLEKVKVKESR